MSAGSAVFWALAAVFPGVFLPASADAIVPPDIEPEAGTAGGLLLLPVAAAIVFLVIFLRKRKAKKDRKQE